MKSTIKITNDVTWIGILDTIIKTFDVVMTTEYGTTYNSYFINAEKKAIIDTSKVTFWDDYKPKVLEVTDPAEIEYIIMNHTEYDHSGNLPNLLKLAPNAKLVASPSAHKFLKDQYGDIFDPIVVKDGDTLDLGNKTIKFINAPNLHWPDTIYSYLVEDKLLFTCDSFGAHYCPEALFDDEIENKENYNKAFEYYFDVILKPFSKFFLQAIEKVRALDIQMICPGHGPVLRTDYKKIVDLSEKLSQEYIDAPQKNYVYMPYVSAYGNTRKIGESIAKGIMDAGDIEVKLHDVEEATIGDIEAELTRSAAILVGSPTINQNILLPIYKTFALINPIRDRMKLCSGFGSFGWSGESKNIIPSVLKSLKLKYFKEGVFLNFSLLEERIEECYQFGKEFGEELNKKNKL